MPAMTYLTKYLFAFPSLVLTTPPMDAADKQVLTASSIITPEFAGGAGLDAGLGRQTTGSVVQKNRQE